MDWDRPPSILLPSIQSYGHITICLFIISGTFRSCPVWAFMNGTVVSNRSSVGHMISVSYDSVQLFSWVAVLSPLAVYESLPVALQSHQHLTLPGFLLLWFLFQPPDRCVVTALVALICISLLVKNGVSFHALICHPHLSWVKCLFTSFDHFFSWVVCSLIRYLWVIWKCFAIIKTVNNIACKALPPFWRAYLN